MNTWLSYGAIAAIVLSVPMLVPYFLLRARPEWMEIGEPVGYGSMLTCLGATWFAVHGERDRSRTVPVAA